MVAAAIVLLVLAPTMALARAGARWRWFLLGVASWMVALLVKIPCVLALYTLDGTPRMGPSLTAVGHGTLSAVAELGFAALFLRIGRPRLVDAIGFGAAIGSFEIVWTLMEGILELSDAGQLTKDSIIAMVSVAFLVERAITLVSHTASRVLVWAAMTRRSLIPGAIALAPFSLCDGVAVYGASAGWHWEDWRVIAGFDVFLAALAALEVTAAWRFTR